MAQEKNFENKVKRYLESLGIYPFGTADEYIATPIIGYYEKRWGGGQFAKSGLPDMHVVVKGISFELELKAPNGKPSPLQLKNLSIIEKSESIGCILVEHDKTVDRINAYISTNYPEFSNVSVISFDNFKKNFEKIIMLLSKTLDFPKNKW